MFPVNEEATGDCNSDNSDSYFLKATNTLNGDSRFIEILDVDPLFRFRKPQVTPWSSVTLENVIVTSSKQFLLFMAIEALLLSVRQPGQGLYTLEIPMPVWVNINVHMWKTVYVVWITFM